MALLRTWVFVLVAGAALPLASARADDPMPGADEREPDDAAPDAPMERPGEQRIVDTAMVLGVPPTAVLQLDDGALTVALDELEEIEEQRTAAQVMGVIGAILLTAGIIVSATANVIDEAGFYRGLAGWGMCAIGGVLAAVATVFQIDVPYRWQRWAASLGFR